MVSERESYIRKVMYKYKFSGKERERERERERYWVPSGSAHYLFVYLTVIAIVGKVAGFSAAVVPSE